MPKRNLLSGRTSYSKAQNALGLSTTYNNLNQMLFTFLKSCWSHFTKSFVRQINQFSSYMIRFFLKNYPKKQHASANTIISLALLCLAHARTLQGEQRR